MEKEKVYLCAPVLKAFLTSPTNFEYSPISNDIVIVKLIFFPFHCNWFRSGRLRLETCDVEAE